MRPVTFDKMPVVRFKVCPQISENILFETKNLPFQRTRQSMEEARKMDTKMIFLDLDGTLLDDEKNLPKANREAIDEALALGHKVLICTGRPLSSAIKQVPVLGLNRPGCYAITYNGGLIYDIGEKKTVYKRTLPIDQVKYLFKKAYEYGGIHIQTYTDRGFICEQDTKESREYARMTKTERRVVKDVAEALNGQEPCKVLAVAIGYDRKRIEGFRRSLLEWAEGKLDVCFSSYELLEFVPEGVSKGNAVRQMSKLLGIPVENTIAVGDAENDISMIQAAGIGAVMKNANDDIKQYGDYITEKNNNEGGVAEVIRKFMLEQKSETTE